MWTFLANKKLISFILRYGEIEFRVLTALERTKVNILGMVVNGVSGGSGYGGYYYSKDYYGSRESEEGVEIKVG